MFDSANSKIMSTVTLRTTVHTVFEFVESNNQEVEKLRNPTSPHNVKTKGRKANQRLLKDWMNYLRNQVCTWPLENKKLIFIKDGTQIDQNHYENLFSFINK